MKFKTLEELIAAWRQAETEDDGKRYHLLWADGTDGGGLSRFDQWAEDRRRWVKLSMAEAALKLFLDLGRDRYETGPDGLQRKRMKRVADVDLELARYALEEVSQ